MMYKAQVLKSTLSVSRRCKEWPSFLAPRRLRITLILGVLSFDYDEIEDSLTKTEYATCQRSTVKRSVEPVTGGVYVRIPSALALV